MEQSTLLQNEFEILNNIIRVCGDIFDKNKFDRIIARGKLWNLYVEFVCARKYEEAFVCLEWHLWSSTDADENLWEWNVLNSFAARIAGYSAEHIYNAIVEIYDESSFKKTFDELLGNHNTTTTEHIILGYLAAKKERPQEIPQERLQEKVQLAQEDSEENPQEDSEEAQLAREFQLDIEILINELKRIDDEIKDCHDDEAKIEELEDIKLLLYDDLYVKKYENKPEKIDTSDSD